MQKDFQARNLNREDAVEEADKDWMMIRMVGGCVSSGTGSPG